MTMKNNQDILSKEQFSLEAQEVFNDWENLIENIINLYSRSVNALLHSKFADKEDVAPIRDIAKVCYSFIGDFQNLM